VNARRRPSLAPTDNVMADSKRHRSPRNSQDSPKTPSHRGSILHPSWAALLPITGSPPFNQEMEVGMARIFGMTLAAVYTVPRFKLAILLGCLLILAGLSATADDLCGATIAEDLKLHHDLTCAGAGLIVGADGIRST